MGNKLIMIGAPLVGLAVGFAGGLFFLDGAKNDKSRASTAVTTLSFSRGAAVGSTLVGAWGQPSDGCIWSDGRGEVQLEMLGIQSSQPVEISIEADGHVSTNRPLQSVNIILNGSLMSTMKFATGAPRGKTSFVASTALLQMRTPATLAFIEDQPMAPSATGAGSETRPRSVCLRRIVIEKAKA